MEHLAVSLVVITVLGIGGQWLAWRLRIPSILVLLVFGFSIGNLTHLVEPDEMFGDILFPGVSLAVALILFEGGLTLRYDELRDVGSTVLNLLSAGALITWVLGGVAAWAILGLQPGPAALISAILVVTGPTVISPLLRHVRPVGSVGSILKWEGIAIDPVGAMLTVLILEAVVSGRFGREATITTVVGALFTLAVGAGIGLAAGWVLRELIRRFWVPDFLQNPVAIAFVFIAFEASNAAQAESGLLAAPVVGLVLANSKGVSARHIVEFQENVRVLLLAGLFIVLGARADIVTLTQLGPQSFVYLGALILIVRPVSVLVATIGSKLNARERIFLGAVAPRGVVAAAVSSVAAIRLEEAGSAVGGRLVAEVFLVIVGTVAIYGLAARPLARLLGLTQKAPKGLLIVGAYAWVRQIAAALQDHGRTVLLVDTNFDNVRAAKMAGLNAVQADATSPHALDDVDMDGIGRLLAMTSNDEFNALSAMNFAETFGRAGVYRLHPDTAGNKRRALLDHGHGRLLFSEDATFSNLTLRCAQGAEVRATKLSDVFTTDDLQRTHGTAMTPLFVLTAGGDIGVYTADHRPSAGPGDVVVSIVAAHTQPAPEAEQAPAPA